MKIRNFERNVVFQPSGYFEPKAEQEVLAILENNRHRRSRTIGHLHSWSEAPTSDDVGINLKHLDHIQIDHCHGENTVRVGGGCQLKRLIARLDEVGLALPSQGLITEQTVAGAISTGTHGSGKNSLSHYAKEIKVIVYDPHTQKPVVRVLREGEELLVARCSLGCLGIILDVKLPCQPQYNIEEHFQFMEGVEEILAAEEKYPLQQFYLLPHVWKLMTQLRRVSMRERSALAPLSQAYWFTTIDVGLHLVLLSLPRVFRSRRLVENFYRWIVPWTVVRGWRVVDKSQRILTMEHELFRHVEIEVFVKRSQLEECLDFVRALLCYCGGSHSTIRADTFSKLRNQGLSDSLEALEGNYTHYYPICVRKVLPDATLISMASGEGEPYYAISFINYNRVGERTQFYQFARLLAEATACLFNARPHWRKIFPMDCKLVEQLYPRLEAFRGICDSMDPEGHFRNSLLDNLLFRSE